MVAPKKSMGKAPKAPNPKPKLKNGFERQRDYGFADTTRPMTEDQYRRYVASVKKDASNKGRVYGEAGGYRDYLSPSGYDQDSVVQVIVDGKIKTLPKYRIGPKRGPIKNVPKGYK